MQDLAYGLPGWSVAQVRSQPAGGGDGVVDFASWVVDMLAARRAAADGPMRPDVLAQLARAVADPDPAPLSELMRDLVRQKVSAVAGAGVLIPAVAAPLGEDWMDDRAGFAEVTLASARLQSMLRALGAAWSADRADGVSDPCLLLCVAPHEQHTLGALVVLGQLRRSGASVRLVTDPGAEDMAALLGSLSLDGVMISASGSVRLAELAQFVGMVRKLGPPGLPIVLGGGVLGAIPGAAARVGADAGAMNISQALAACGIGSAREDRARLRA